MKKTFVLFGVISALMLSSCGTKDTSVPVGSVVPVVEYPTTQTETPATKFCTEHGGTISIEVNPESTEVAYCTLKTGEKIDAWKYMSDETNETRTGVGQ